MPEAPTPIKEDAHEKNAKLNWLRAAVRESMDQIDRGEGLEFRSLRDLDEHLDRLAAESRGEGKHPD